MHSLNIKLLHMYMRINALGNFDFNPLITTNAAALAGYRISIIVVNKDSRTAVLYGGDER